ncbi:transporter substrate-binding domain-containing protein [Candidatus Phytoplasma pruni]|uniref:Transporter substrate-binding domain-containing protein n=1 Tax=Candidatus Phytoplasma pruni TaxID=479893 RepID=A0A851HJC5_9MOLU|nr:transporter substrate-binding domain-containing protein [Candidatus Phytoplasma pruni]NWN45646.1 transporter substrate-binding domain-containing protein [Candidatus Phytoplasma pruni]
METFILKKYLLKNWKKISIGTIIAVLFVWLNFHILMPNGVKKGGKEPLTLGIVNNAPPFAFDGTNEKNGYETVNGDFISGSDIELFKAIANEMKRELIIRTFSFPGILNAVKQGTVDVIIGMLNITPERQEQMLSIQYHTPDLGILVRKDDPLFKKFTKENNQEVKLKDLEEVQRITTIIGSIYDIQFFDTLQKNQHLPKAKKTALKEDAVNCAESVSNGTADVLLLEYPVVDLIANQQPDKFKAFKLKDLPEAIKVPPLGMFLQKGKGEQLKKDLEGALKEVLTQDKTYQNEYHPKAIEKHQKVIQSTKSKTSFFKTYYKSFLISLLLAFDGLLLGFILSLLFFKIKLLSVNAAVESPVKKSFSIKNIFSVLIDSLIYVLKAVPISIQVILVYNLLVLNFDFFKVNSLGSFYTALIIILINNATILTSVFVNNMKLLDKGQIEAAYSLGMEKKQVFSYIILRQTLKRSMPFVWNQLIINFKETALFSIIGLSSLLWTAQRNIVLTNDTITPFVIVSVIYLTLNYLTKYIGKKINKN